MGRGHDMQKNYVLITPARNEEKYIERTIQSVISQTILPEKWVIVSDGSTDGTDEIVKRYEAHYDFIQFMCLESNGERNFASQVYAQQVGVELLQDIKYEFIGMLDADISFQPDYYENILRKCDQNPKLGIAGGSIFEKHQNRFRRQFASVNSVAGGIQLFRRQCYEDVGGYIPVERGGQDGIAEVMARMHGWEVKSFPDIEVLHHRRTGLEIGHILLVYFREGIKEYSNGYHPLFEMAKCLARATNRPFALGSIFKMSGFLWACLRRVPRSAPSDIITYLRREQMQRLLAIFRGHKPI
jgi:glycosyltransferase involved in cell wall biosynthesis